MAAKYCESLTPIALQRYKEKLSVIGLAECPYEIPNEEWIDDPSQWPSLHYHQLYHYLTKTPIIGSFGSRPELFSPEAMENYKSLEAWRYFQDGWVQKIVHVNVSDVVVMRADVRPSYRTTAKPHNPWVATSKTGTVLAGHCDCMAGLGETCSHVAAVLYKVEAAVRMGMTLVTPTDIPCRWNQNFTRCIKGAPLANISVYNASSKEKTKALQAPMTPVDSEAQDFNSFLKSVHAVAPKAIGLSLFKQYQQDFSETKVSRQETTPKLPNCLRSLYSLNYIEMKTEDLEHIKDSVISELCGIADFEKLHVEECTRNQSESHFWYEQRVGRITGSTVHQVLHTSFNCPSRSLLMKICALPGSTEVLSHSQKWGRQHESVAFDEYEQVFAGLEALPAMKSISDCVIHSGLQVKKVGLCIASKPWYAASPDGVISCECCGLGVLEIKCPFNVREKSLKEEICTPVGKAGNFYIEFVDGQYKLKEQHQYFSQVQLQMYVTGTSYCDFMVWTPAEFLCLRVSRQEKYIENLIATCDMFWRDIILTELLTRSIENNSTCEK